MTERTYILTFVLVAATTVPTGAAEQRATTTDGKVVTLKDDGTWTYAATADKAPAPADEYSGAEGVIKEKCKTEWPDDFQMREHCEKQQRSAVETLKPGKPAGVDGDTYSVVHKKCAKDWPDDYQMRAHCESQQFESWRRLKR
jgi:hypothetical protein